MSSTLDEAAWAFHLADYPDPSFVHTIIHIIRHGAAIGYQGGEHDQQCVNLKSAFEFPETITSDIETLAAAGRIHGPFSSPPLPHFRVSPLGTVPKKYTSKRRRIHHLSWPPGTSVNDGIPEEEVNILYDSFAAAVADVQKAGQGCLLGKLDLRDAFRHIPVRPADWHYLGFTWLDRLWYDIVLSFGLSSAPYIFNLFAEALHWIISRHIPAFLRHYLDDFLPVFRQGTSWELASAALEWIQALGTQLGLSFQESKTEGPATCLTFLGIEIDTLAMEARLPADKLDRLHALLSTWCLRDRCNLRELQELIGLLHFAATVVPFSRAFIRRLIDFSSHFPSQFSVRHLPRSAHSDILWWYHFVRRWNGVRLITPTRPVLHVYTDASGTKGLGGILGNKWFSARVPHRFRDRDIQFKELLAVCEAVRRWQADLSGHHVVFHIDNQAVAVALQELTNRSIPTMALLRDFLGMVACLDFSFSASWLSSKENSLADCASRFLYAKLFELAPYLDRQPSSNPRHSPGMISTHSTRVMLPSTSGTAWHPALARPTVLVKNPSLTTSSSTDFTIPTDPLSLHPNQPSWLGSPSLAHECNPRQLKATSPMFVPSMSIQTSPSRQQRRRSSSDLSEASSAIMESGTEILNSPSPLQSSVKYCRNSAQQMIPYTGPSMERAVSPSQPCYVAESSQSAGRANSTPICTSPGAQSHSYPISALQPTFSSPSLPPRLTPSERVSPSQWQLPHKPHSTLR